MTAEIRRSSPAADQQPPTSVITETFPFPAGLTPNIPAKDYADDPRAIAIASAAKRLDELRNAWLNPPDLVDIVPELVPGYPDRLGLQSQDELTEFEHAISSQRAEEPLPAGNLDQPHYCALHRHLYQDVYDWAGELRTVRTSKGGNMFCYPENIAAQLTKLFGELAAAKQLIAAASGHGIEFSRLDAPAMLQAMIASFSENEEPLARLIRQLI